MSDSVNLYVLGSWTKANTLMCLTLDHCKREIPHRLHIAYMVMSHAQRMCTLLLTVSRRQWCQGPAANWIATWRQNVFVCQVCGLQRCTPICIPTHGLFLINIPFPLFGCSLRTGLHTEAHISWGTKNCCRLIKLILQKIKRINDQIHSRSTYVIQILTSPLKKNSFLYFF